MIELLALAQEALKKETPPEAPPKVDWLVPNGAIALGVLPIPLQNLYAFCEKVIADMRAEKHRRCVQILGKEEYDHEVIEYMVHCEVEADPRFTDFPKLKHFLDLEIAKHFPVLKVNRIGVPRYAMGKNWQLLGVPK